MLLARLLKVDLDICGSPLYSHGPCPEGSLSGIRSHGQCPSVAAGQWEEALEFPGGALQPCVPQGDRPGTVSTPAAPG